MLTVSPAAKAAIDADYALNRYLGQPVTDYLATSDGGAYRDYQQGSIYWSSYTGAHDITGDIKAKWLGLGGVTWGYPSTDQTRTPDGVGFYNHFELQTRQFSLHGGFITVSSVGAIDWTPASAFNNGQAGAHEVDGAIYQKFSSLGAENWGEAVTNATPTSDGTGSWYNHFERTYTWGLGGAAIDWTPASAVNNQQAGAHEVDGLIYQKFAGLGAESWGEAITDATPTSDATGSWYNHFERTYSWGLGGAAIDWTPQAGAHEVDGAIYQKFSSLGAENWGEAVTDATPTSDGSGSWYNHFEHQYSWGLWGAAIDWTPQAGAHEVDGLIYQKFFSLGYENTFGEATTDATPTPDGSGSWYNHFEHLTPWGMWPAAIDWTPQYQAHEVDGLIAQKFAGLGWENFGEAITDATPTPDNFGWYNHFQRQYGTITSMAAIDWTPTYGACEIFGAIAGEFQNLGWEAFGEVTADEAVFSNASNLPPYAAYAHFQLNAPGGPEPSAIDWTATNGAHIVYGAIYQYFINHGGELGQFGFATSDEMNGSYGAGSRMNLFQNGEIQWQPGLYSDSDNNYHFPVILSVYKLNSTTVRFNWDVAWGSDSPTVSGLSSHGYLVRYGLVGNPGGETQLDLGNGFGDTGSYDESNLNPGSTYVFTIDPYYSVTIGNSYEGWAADLVYTLT
jgi:uncharacterized protein with LGFP repeats